MENICVGLFGTCGGSKWREPFEFELGLRGIPFFNPQVEDWHPGCIAEENAHLANDDIILFPVTSETTGQGSLGEIGFSILNALRMNKNRFCVFMIDDDCVDPNANEAHIKDSLRNRKLVKSKVKEEAARNPNVFLVETLDEMLSMTIDLADISRRLLNLKVVND